MATIRLNFLSEEEEDIIHAQSIKTLEQIGVKVHSEKVLEQLNQMGANVDLKSKIAKIPEDLVKESLDKAPKRIRLCARDPKRDLEIPVKSYPYTATNGLAIEILDLDTGKLRSSTRKDIADFVRLGDALDSVDYLWTSLTATDVPQLTHGSHEIWAALQNTTKHVQGVTVQSGLDARKQIELASLVVGGEEELMKRPIISVISCPIAPLTFEKGAIEAQVEFAKAGLPVCSMSMSLGGLSSPVTLAGTIANVNTENLASIVISQSFAPGAPHVYTSESTPIEMKTGIINYNAPEVPLISAAAGQMARRYGLPCMVAGCGTNGGRMPGIQGSFCEITSGFLPLMSGTDLAAGMGSIDVAKGCSFEQLVIDAYLWEQYRSFMRDFVVDSESIALDVVKEVGHGNSFLTHPHTAKNFKKELFFWDKKKLAWQATLSTDMVPEAREVAKKLLKEHKVVSLDPDILQKGDKILRDYEKQMS
ncbi:MAG TPA: hypothetical protein ENN25_01210 [Euryarchaeota archaeon]|nr:hypothetical protein [Euryarchaeota archaeon]